MRSHKPAILICIAIALVHAACLAPDPDELDVEPAARVVIAWDPLACGDPHRVAVELEDDAGVPVSTSTVCHSGSASVDVRHFGIYRGRVYAWSAGEIRGELPMQLAVDAPVVRWFIETPR